MKARFIRRGIQLIRSWMPLFTVILVTFAFRSAVADWNDIPSGSMKPTIIEGDRIFINKVAYDLKIPFTTLRLARWDHPERGDIVVFFSPADGKRLVKRVLGLPGDSIEMRDNRLVINGVPVEYSRQEKPVVSGETPPGEVPHYLLTEHLEKRPHTVTITPSFRSLSSFGPVIVPVDHYLMLGDNRDNSADSRYIGFIKDDRIIGEATAVVFSLRLDEHYLPRWNRFCEKLE